MAKAETDILNKWRLKWATWATLLRNNTGTFMTLDGSRMVQAGLGKGTFDFIGWKSVEITPDMIGKKVAIFTAVEGKAGDGQLSPEQTNFLIQVRRAGGIAFVVRSENTVPSSFGE